MYHYPGPAPAGPATDQNYTAAGAKNSRLDKEQALGILNHLNRQELQDLLDNDTKLEQLVDDNQQVKALSVEKTTIVASNKSLSEYNLSREPRLTQGKERLSASHVAAQDLHRTVTEKKSRVDANAGGISLEEAQALLKTSAESMENETDAISESFLNGDLSIDTFLDTYIEKRTLAHNRKIKAEKMSEMSRQRVLSGPQQSPQRAVTGQWPSTVPPISGAQYTGAPVGGVPPYPPRSSPYNQPAYTAPYRSPYATGGAMPMPQAYMPR